MTAVTVPLVTATMTTTSVGNTALTHTGDTSHGKNAFCHDSMNICWMKVRLGPTKNTAPGEPKNSEKMQQQEAHFSMCHPTQQ